MTVSRKLNATDNNSLELLLDILCNSPDNSGMSKKIKIPAFAYLRVSGKGQMNGHGFDRQAETINTYAAEHGYNLDQI